MVNFKTLFLFLIVSVFISCSIDSDLPDTQLGAFSISFEPPATLENARVKGNTLNKVTHLVITIKHMDGRDTEYSLTKIAVNLVEGAFLSEEILLPLGTYQITTLYLVDSEDNILFASPHNDAPLAQNVETSLPITDISVSDSTEIINGEVISTDGHSPDDFGMDSFKGKFKEVFYFYVAILGENKGETYLPGQIEVVNGKYSHQQGIDSLNQKVILEPGHDQYTIKIESENYHPFEDTFSYDSLSSYVSTPLIIELELLDPCVGGTYVGDVVLNTQEEVDDFGSKCYKKIEGHLKIGAYYIENLTSITNLESLDSLVEVTGSLKIEFNQSLKSLKGLNNLSSVGGILTISGNEILGSLSELKITRAKLLAINNNNALTNFDGLQGLRSLNSVEVRGNQNLVNFKGLENLKSIETSLNITKNKNLNSFEGLENLEELGGLNLVANSSLVSLSGFKNSITSLNHLYLLGNSSLRDLKGMLSEDCTIKNTVIIDNNPSLESLEGLRFHNDITFNFELTDNSSLTDISAMSDINTIGRDLIISNNEKLSNLTGLENLFSVGNLYGSESGYILTIVNNKSLTNFCPLSYLFQNGILYKQNIKLNGYNPTVLQMKENECSP